MSDISRRHRWNESDHVRISGIDCADGNDRTQKSCALCGLIKITVHPPHGFPWREWKTKDGKVWQGASTPPCLDSVPAEVMG